MKLEHDFFTTDNVVGLAKELIGTIFHTNINGKHCAGIVTETEAYAGVTDRASHAFGGRLTKRTEVMYREGGIAYVYFTYGMHCLFNVVSATEGTPHAVLLRAVWPVAGIETMMERRSFQKDKRLLTNGPAKLAQAFGITLEHNATSLCGDLIWFEKPSDNCIEHIVESPRIGVDYAGVDAALNYRFVGAPDEKIVRRMFSETNDLR